MARPTHIKPFLPPGRHGYYASYAGPNGKRCNASLATDDLEEATRVCRDLMTLQAERLREGSPASLLICPRAYRLWFGSDIPNDLPQDDEDPDAEFEGDISDRSELLLQIKLLEKELARLRPFEAKYNALSEDLEARRLKAHRNSPTFEDVREAYFEDLKTLAKEGYISRTWFKRFSEHIDGAKTRIAAITPAQILSFIQKSAKDHDDAQRAKRERSSFTRFFAWAARTHQIVSPMDQVPITRAKADKDISWPSIEEVNAILTKEKSVYWRAIIATLTYAGLSAHELRGLKMSDIQAIPGGKRILRIQPHEERGLKSANRKRSVQISSRLAVYLDAYLESRPKKTKCEYVFPAEAGTNKSGLWHEGAFTRHLRSRLPKKITALHLRRTFGSLLIRSGKNETEVAAAMGNTPTMVRQHYARILGGEINFEF